MEDRQRDPDWYVGQGYTRQGLHSVYHVEMKLESSLRVSGKPRPKGTLNSRKGKAKQETSPKPKLKVPGTIVSPKP